MQKASKILKILAPQERATDSGGKHLWLAGKAASTRSDFGSVSGRPWAEFCPRSPRPVRERAEDMFPYPPMSGDWRAAALFQVRSSVAAKGLGAPPAQNPQLW